MTNQDFYDAYSSEDKCLAHFKATREKDGVTCRKCQGTEHYWLETKRQFQCKKCRFRTGIKSGTLLENSKLPIKKWYEAFHFITMSKKPTSAKTIERHLKVHYETAWFLMHKIRIALGRRNAQYVLSGNVEVDECMLSVSELSAESNESEHQKKRGRGANKAKILVMNSFDDRVNKKQKLKRYGKSIAMEVIEDFTEETIKKQMTKWITKNSKIYTDKFQSYKPIKKHFDEIIMKVSSGELAKEHLPVVHQSIGNLKRNILGLHHCVSQLHLSNYLAEFCYKLNRNFMLKAEYKGKPLLENIVLQSVRFLW